MIIYKITNKINGKIYIGQTINSVKKRWKEHCNYKKVSAISKAIRKYGQENFEVKIIVKANSINELNHREELCIKLFNSFAPNGYNLISGGKNAKRSEETRKRLSLVGMGKRQSEETKLKRSKSMMGKNTKYLSPSDIEARKVKEKQRKKKLVKKIPGWINPQIGKVVTKKSRLKNAKSNGGGRSFVVFDKCNNLIWHGQILSDCARELNLSVGNICSCLKGHRKQHKGYTFKFELIHGK